MARIALTIGGAVIGAILGAATFTPFGVWAGIQGGLALGGLAGLAFPGKGPHTYGPRLLDNQIQSSTNGTFIEFGGGWMRIAGNVIWAPNPPIKETQVDTQQSAKGGGATSTTYTYTASFAVAFCEGPAMITRLWGDSKLMFDATGSGDPIVASLAVEPAMYSGSEDQMPDPTIEAIEGVGFTPAFRGICYIVFENLPLANFGNRIPNIRAEVIMHPEWRTTAGVGIDNLVSDICQRSGLDPTLFDVTLLAPFFCLGFAVSRPADARGAILPLSQAFFFDAVETDFKLHFIPRMPPPPPPTS